MLSNCSVVDDLDHTLIFQYNGLLEQVADISQRREDLKNDVLEVRELLFLVLGELSYSKILPEVQLLFDKLATGHKSDREVTLVSIVRRKFNAPVLLPFRVRYSLMFETIRKKHVYPFREYPVVVITFVNLISATKDASQL